MTRYNYNSIDCKNCEGYCEVREGKLTFECSIKNSKEYPSFNTASDCLRSRRYKEKKK